MPSCSLMFTAMWKSRCACKHTIAPAQLGPQVVHVDLDLLQRLPVQRLQPDALHQPLHAYPGDACNVSTMRSWHPEPLSCTHMTQ